VRGTADALRVWESVHVPQIAAVLGERSVLDGFGSAVGEYSAFLHTSPDRPFELGGGVFSRGADSNDAVPGDSLINLAVNEEVIQGCVAVVARSPRARRRRPWVRATAPLCLKSGAQRCASFWLGAVCPARRARLGRARKGCRSLRLMTRLVISEGSSLRVQQGCDCVAAALLRAL
jgi:hypothetical protein